jgi:hypothetical protein
MSSHFILSFHQKYINSYVPSEYRMYWFLRMNDTNIYVKKMATLWIFYVFPYGKNEYYLAHSEISIFLFHRTSLLLYIVFIYCHMARHCCKLYVHQKHEHRWMVLALCLLSCWICQFYAESDRCIATRLTNSSFHTTTGKFLDNEHGLLGYCNVFVCSPPSTTHSKNLQRQ